MRPKQFKENNPTKLVLANQQGSTLLLTMMSSVAVLFFTMYTLSTRDEVVASQQQVNEHFAQKAIEGFVESILMSAPSCVETLSQASSSGQNQLLSLKDHNGDEILYPGQYLDHARQIVFLGLEYDQSQGGVIVYTERARNFSGQASSQEVATYNDQLEPQSNPIGNQSSQAVGSNRANSTTLEIGSPSQRQVASGNYVRNQDFSGVPINARGLDDIATGLSGAAIDPTSGNMINFDQSQLRDIISNYSQTPEKVYFRSHFIPLDVITNGSDEITDCAFVDQNIAQGIQRNECLLRGRYWNSRLERCSARGHSQNEVIPEYLDFNEGRDIVRSEVEDKLRGVASLNNCLAISGFDENGEAICL